MSKTRDGLLDDLAMLGFALEAPFRGLSGKRRFRWDAAREQDMVAVEYQGIGVGHQWHQNQTKDREKLNEAALLGWRVIQCDAETVGDGRCWTWVMKALGEA